MSNDKSRPIYPPDEHNYFGEFRNMTPMADTVLGNVREAEIEAAKKEIANLMIWRPVKKLLLMI